MNNYEFYEVLLNNISLYIFLMLFFIAGYIFIYRKIITNLINPIFLPVVYSAIGTATVFTLFFSGNMNSYLFSNFCLTQLAYLIGVFSLGYVTTVKSFADYSLQERFNINIDKVLFGKIALHVFVLIMVLVHLIIYKTKGIPLFQVSRLEVFADGSGFGLYSRFSDVSIVAVIYLYFCFYFYNISFKFYYHFFIVLAFLFLLLSGSKTALLTIPFILFCFLLLHKSSDEVKHHYLIKNLKRIILITFGLAIAFVILVISIQSATLENDDLAAFSLLLRFIHSGDTFWYSYPNNIILKCQNPHGLLALFNDFLGFTRIYKWEELPPNLGLQLIRYHHTGDGIFGPNARHNVFGIAYFGYYGSIVFSLIIGLVVSFAIHVLPSIFRFTFIPGIFFCIAFMSLISLELDPMLAMTSFDNALIIFPICLIFIFSIYAVIAFGAVAQKSIAK